MKLTNLIIPFLCLVCVGYSVFLRPLPVREAAESEALSGVAVTQGYSLTTGGLFRKPNYHQPGWGTTTNWDWEKADAALTGGGTVLTVDPSGNGQYATITLALAAADAGDVVVVLPGAYDEAIKIPAGVAVVGTSRENSIINYSVTDSDTAVTMAHGSSIDNMTVKITLTSGASKLIQGIAPSRDVNCTITHCDVICSGVGTTSTVFAVGSYYSAATSSETVTVEDCYIYAYGANAIGAFWYGAGGSITGSKEWTLRNNTIVTEFGEALSSYCQSSHGCGSSGGNSKLYFSGNTLISQRHGHVIENSDNLCEGWIKDERILITAHPDETSVDVVGIATPCETLLIDGCYIEVDISAATGLTADGSAGIYTKSGEGIVANNCYISLKGRATETLSGIFLESTGNQSTAECTITNSVVVDDGVGTQYGITHGGTGNLFLSNVTYPRSKVSGSGQIKSLDNGNTKVLFAMGKASMTADTNLLYAAVTISTSEVDEGFYCRADGCITAITYVWDITANAAAPATPTLTLYRNGAPGGTQVHQDAQVCTTADEDHANVYTFDPGETEFTVGDWLGITFDEPAGEVLGVNATVTVEILYYE